MGCEVDQKSIQSSEESIQNDKDCLGTLKSIKNFMLVFMNGCDNLLFS